MPSVHKDSKSKFAHALRDAVSAALSRDWTSRNAGWRCFDDYRTKDFREAATVWEGTPLADGYKAYGAFAIQPWIGDEYVVGGVLVVLREYPLSVKGHFGAPLDEWITCKEMQYISEEQNRRGQYTTLRRALSVSKAAGTNSSGPIRFGTVPHAGISWSQARDLSRRVAITDLVKLFAPFDHKGRLPLNRDCGFKSGSRHSDQMYSFAAQVLPSELSALQPKKVVFLGSYSKAIRSLLGEAVRRSDALALFLPHPQAFVASWQRQEGFCWE
jgi:hypothetical protein